MTLILKIAPVLVLSFWLLAQPAYAQVDRIVRGAGKTFFSTLQIPKCMIQQSTTMFPLGLVTGTLKGTYQAVAGTVSGAVDMAAGAAPYAKYLIFFI